MIDPRIRLKNRGLAVLLAWMLPGAGHFYQERRFKSAIYFCSIVGLWVMAMHLSQWKVMAAPFNERNERPPIIQVLKFGAQSGVGLPAVCAVVQRERVKDDENDPVKLLDEPMDAEFIGKVDFQADAARVDEDVTGTVSFERTEGEFGQAVQGHFDGTTADGTKIVIDLDAASLGRPVDGDNRRSFTAAVIKEGDTVGDLRGTIPRSTANWLFVPLNVQQETVLHRTLGKHHELATLLSVVAGLLNILAMFDAFGGPAYGYGDEVRTRVPGAAPQTTAADESRRAVDEAKELLRRASEARHAAIENERRTQEQVSHAHRDKQNAERALQTARTQHQQSAQQLEDSRQRLSLAQADVAETQRQVEQNERQLAAVRNSLTNDPQSESLVTELAVLERSMTDLQQSLVAGNQRVAASLSQLAEAQSRETRMSDAVRKADTGVVSANDKVDAAQRLSSQATEARIQAERAHADAESQLQRLTQKPSQPTRLETPQHVHS